jgi:hypothetical protein
VALRLTQFGGRLVLAATLLGGFNGLAAAQSAVTQADILRLQDNIYDASRDVAQLRTRDQALASQLEAELDEARDETIYLKVKIRKKEPTTRSEYSELRDRIDGIRTQARGEIASRSAPPAPAARTEPAAARPAPAPVERRAPRATGGEVRVGTELDVRLQTTLSSATAQVEDRFEATTIVDLIEGDAVLVPAGSVMRGVVSGVNKAGRVDRRGSLTLAFDQITVDGQSYPIRATVTQALESEGVRGEAGRIGTGAGVGAIIGGILGGFKGALAGILIGAGGTVAATEGTDVELPAGTVLRVRLDTGLILD